MHNVVKCSQEHTFQVQFLNCGDYSCGMSTLFLLIHKILGNMCVYMPSGVFTNRIANIDPERMVKMANARVLFRLIGPDETIIQSKVDQFYTDQSLSATMIHHTYPQVVHPASASVYIGTHDMQSEHIRMPIAQWPSRFIHTRHPKLEPGDRIINATYVADPNILTKINIHEFFSFIVHQCRLMR